MAIQFLITRRTPSYESVVKWRTWFNGMAIADLMTMKLISHCLLICFSCMLGICKDPEAMPFQVALLIILAIMASDFAVPMFNIRADCLIWTVLRLFESIFVFVCLLCTVVVGVRHLHDLIPEIMDMTTGGQIFVVFYTILIVASSASVLLDISWLALKFYSWYRSRKIEMTREIDEEENVVMRLYIRPFDS